MPAEQTVSQESQYGQPRSIPQPPPQLSPDGRWWWNGNQWVPIPPPKPPGAGALASWALGFGIVNASMLGMYLLGSGFVEPFSGFNPGGGGVFFGLAIALPGLVLGILALARPGHRHDRRRRRSLAWTAIGLSLLSFAGWYCLFLFV